MNEIQKAASLLGKMNKGVKKTLTDAERLRRKDSLTEARKKRWLKNDNQTSTTGTEHDTTLSMVQNRWETNSTAVSIKSQI